MPDEEIHWPLTDAAGGGEAKSILLRHLLLWVEILCCFLIFLFYPPLLGSPLPSLSPSQSCPFCLPYVEVPLQPP